MGAMAPYLLYTEEEVEVERGQLGQMAGLMVVTAVQAALLQSLGHLLLMRVVVVEVQHLN
jgi:hypothetical protein